MVRSFPLRKRFSKADCHLDERLRFHRRGQVPARAFRDLDNPSRQYLQQRFGLYVPCRQRIGEQRDLLHFQSGALGERLDLIEMKKKNVAVGVRFELD